MNRQQLFDLTEELVRLPHECEWVEFKHNFHSAEEIGQRISALSNGACIHNQPFAYLVFGIEDKTHTIKGTSFRAKSHKKGEENLEHWLATRLNPRIDFTVYEFDYDASRYISMYVIPPAKYQPVEFLHQAYIRVGSITRKLNEFPEKQARIWKKNALPFEKEIAKDNLSAADVTKYLSTETYFDLMRRMRFCEEKGSGLDKVIFYNELYQLPPINVIVTENRTSVTIYSYRSLNDLDKKEKIRACYQHACLKYVSNEKMTNQSLRERFKIEVHNYSIASRIIRDAIEDNVIKEDDPANKSRKYACYIPFWA